MSDLVTGEAVPLEMRLAKFPSRSLALLVDLLILGAATVGVLIALTSVVSAVDAALATALMITTVLGLLVGVPVAVETLTRGRSVGKLVIGLRVVRDDGGPVRFRHALARGLAGFFVDFYLTVGVGAIVCSLLNTHGKRVGDLLAGTVVIRERAPSAGAPAPQMPPQLATWATSLELSRLPDDLALAVRGYFARYPQLSAQARDTVGRQLATEVAQVVTPPTPSGTPAWAYLAAVLAERSRREAYRLANRAGYSHEPPTTAPLPTGETMAADPSTPHPSSDHSGFAPPT